MMTTRDLDAQLEAMFAAQAEALEVPAREWTDATQLPSAGPASRRRAYVVGIAAFSAAAVTLGVLAVGSSTDQTVETNRPAAAPVNTPATSLPRAPFHVETKQVSLDAQALLVDLDDPKKGKRTFTTAAPLEMTGDPGMFNEYTTLELTWSEREVEMRMNIYFKSDGRQWWSDEIRVYDGREEGKWIFYQGDFFRSPIGMPFVGDFEVTAEDHGISGTLRLPGLRLEAFRRPAACTNPAAPFALESPFDRVEVPLDPMAGNGVVVRLLDTATCRPVVDEQSFEVSWTLDDPAIASLQADGVRADFGAKALGTTAAHVSAVERLGRSVSGAQVEIQVVPAVPGSDATAADSPNTAP